MRDTSLNARARKELREEKFLDLTLAIDSLTGASPSGDSSFLDTRTALSATWQTPIKRLSLLSVGMTVSDEYDYTHTGVNAHIARDFNNRNTTLSFGLAIANDSIDPVGGSPVPLAPMLGLGNSTNKRSDQSKDVTDLLVGVTQVLNRHTVVQFNYSLSKSDGYLTDPYKVLSVVGSGVG